MILYHGSFLEIAKPDLVHSRPYVDFGRGFYVTPLHEQAEKWCGKFNRLRYEKPNLQICFRTEKALDFFYHSETYQLIRDGVSDMHCMSDAYLAEELEQEYAEKNAGY